MRRCSSATRQRIFRDKYGLFINGKQVPSVLHESELSVENPATKETLTKVSRASPEDVEIAVQSAQSTFESGVWSKASPSERAKVLYNAATFLKEKIPEFAEKESLQTGRPIREMRAQLTRLPGKQF